MDMENNEIFTIVEDEVQKMSFIQRLVSLFTAPVKLMQNIKYYPKIAAALLLCMGLSLLTLPFVSKITEITTNMMSEIMLIRYGQDFISFMESTQAAANNPQLSAITTASTTLVLLLSYPLMCVIKTLILFIITKIAKGMATFKQYASMYAHILLIAVLGSIITTSIMAAMGTLLDVSSLAAVFMPSGNFSMIPYNLLASISLFTVLEIILAGIGVKEINGFTNRKAIIVVSIIFILSVAFTTIMAGSSVYMMDLSYKALGYQ
ncbi:MAG: YIP1 family protein [Firmicutes bacterium]|nr:YIP1 family protein [Bacillota bacterium]